MDSYRAADLFEPVAILAEPLRIVWEIAPLAEGGKRIVRKVIIIWKIRWRH